MEIADSCWRRGEEARIAGHAAAAAAAYRRTLALVPEFAPAHANLAMVLQAAGGRALGRAIALLPDHPLLRFNLGNLLQATGRVAEARSAFRQSLALAPAEAGAWLNLGFAVHGGGLLAGAIIADRRALALAPAYAQAWNNLANAWRDQGRIEDALAAYGQALALRADYADADRNRLCARLYLDDDDERAGGEARAFVARHRPLPAPAPAWTPPEPERALRIGLLTSDLGDHPIGRNMAGFVAGRDRARTWLAVYDTAGRVEEASRWFRARVDLWRSVAPLDDHIIAEVIRADRIDVLVVLAGRFDKNRPLVAMARPAPVQVAMHDGGPSGMGEGDDPAIAAWITDAVLHPLREGVGEGAGDRSGGDRLVRLPVFYNYPPPAHPPPARVPDGEGPVLGSFSNPAKLSAATLATWGRILARLPDARLLLKYHAWYADPEVQGRVRAAIAGAGGDPGRLLFFQGEAEIAEAHLQHYGRVDLALDPFPFSGATTSFEALAMGVPVLTLPGRAAIGRTTTAILRPLGLDELVSVSQDDYVERASALVRDRSRLARLRREIPGRLAASALLDGPGFAASLEAALRGLWRERCRKLDA